VASQGCDSPHGRLRAGAAQVDITPPLGVSIAGYRQPRRARGVHDPLYAKALVLDDGRTRAALVGLDLCCIPRQDVAALRRLIQRQAHLDRKNVMIWATHTHTGPVTDPHIPPGEPDAEYRSALLPRIADCVDLAISNLRDARWAAGTGRVEGISFNRRAARRGRAKTDAGEELLKMLHDGQPPAVPPIGMDDWQSQASVVDKEVGVLFVEDETGVPIAALVNFALHCDTVGGDLISADYPCFIARTLSDAKGNGIVTLFAPGTCGDINHVNGPQGEVGSRSQDTVPLKGSESASRIGRAIGAEALEVIRGLRFRARVEIRSVSRTLTLQRRKVSPEEVAAARECLARRERAGPKLRHHFFAEEIIQLSRSRRDDPAEIHVLALGSTALIALPGEVFVELGMEIKRRSPFPETFIVTLANGYIGYVPTRAAFAEGGYEVMTAWPSRLTPDAGDILVAAACDTLDAALRGTAS